MTIENQKPAARRGLSVALAVALALLAGGVLPIDAQAPANRNGGPTEGVTVHGHWSIEVRQPDGTVVSHREFENALFSFGALELPNILAGRRVPGAWSINLQSGDFTLQPCLYAPGSPAPCLLQQADWIFQTGANVSNNLTRDVTGLKLTGVATAGRTGHIDNVATTLYTCNSTLSVSACADYQLSHQPGAGLAGILFSGTNLSPAVDVVAGQLVQIEVTYTFQ